MSLSTKESRFDFDPTFSWEFVELHRRASATTATSSVRSFVYAGIATVLCILIGYPLAYVIAFRGGRWHNVLLGLVVVPFFTSFLIRTIAWQTVLFDDGPVLGVARRPPPRWASSSRSGSSTTGACWHDRTAVIGGLTYNFLPFMILPIYVSLEKIDPRLIEAARDLYANGWPAFRKVVLPLSLPGVFAGSLLTFIPAAGDFVNARFLGGPNNTMIGTVVQDRFLVQLDYPTAAALVVRPHGHHHHRRARLRPGARHGGPGVTTVEPRPASDDRAPRGDGCGRPGGAGRSVVAPCGRLRLPVHCRSSSSSSFSFNKPTGQLQPRLAGVHPRQLGRPVRQGGRSRTPWC